MGLFKKIAAGLKKTREALASKIDAIFGRGELNAEFYESLEEILITSDIGVDATEEIVESLKKRAKKEKIKSSEEVKKLLREIIADMLEYETKPEEFPLVIMVVGVNGVGKTTAIGRLANFYKNKGKKVCLAAADTFRAAAIEQLAEWADRSGVKLVKHEAGSDAAAVVFDAISSCKAKNTDVLIIDTAGRLHNNVNLMAELQKISKITAREWAEANIETYIVIDATTGQNGVNQAVEFNNSCNLTGIILTKIDGTAKGGVVLNIKQKVDIPVKFIGTGEGINDIEEFDAESFSEGII